MDVRDAARGPAIWTGMVVPGVKRGNRRPTRRAVECWFFAVYWDDDRFAVVPLVSPARVFPPDSVRPDRRRGRKGRVSERQRHASRLIALVCYGNAAGFFSVRPGKGLVM